MRAAWLRWKSAGEGTHDLPDPSPEFARAWRLAVEWYREQPEHRR
jgi:hypothetical protein